MRNASAPKATNRRRAVVRSVACLRGHATAQQAVGTMEHLAADPDMRVVVPSGSLIARVFDGQDWHDGLPLVPVALAEDEEAVIYAQRADVVLLKERAPTAFVRLRGEWYSDVPLFQARQLPDGRQTEVRVSVHELRFHRGKPT